ncbi:MAG: hypothetical protein KJ064_11830 [Anaerolineae bacterium]|nr:hypothetical protein [Anaerolineae bacterium]
MQQADNVSPSEWRWVAIVSGILVTLTLLPYAWALIASVDTPYTFLGILPNPKDGATYLSKIQQGADGHWLFELRHTPEKHDPAGFHMFYLMLGQVASPLGLSNVVIFHLARVATSLFMFAALYNLGAAIWTRIRPRRLFFILISIGSGLGWLALVFNPNELAPDLIVPEAFPLLAAYTNPHFPLAIGCQALVTTIFIRVFRPGFKEAPTSDNGGLSMIILSVILAIISPPAMVALGGTLFVYTIARGYILTKSARQNPKVQQKLNDTQQSLSISSFQVPLHEARWAAMFILPAAPFALYYFMVFHFNNVFGQFNEQNITPSPNLILFILGYGLLLILAIPGLWRAFRRFEPDGDQFMLIWFVVNVLAIYAPFALQRRLFIGLIIPIIYFAIRSIEDYWVERVPERLRAPGLIALFVFILPTHVFTFGAPLVFAVFDQEAGADNLILVHENYLEAFEQLRDAARPDDVVLASPNIGLWIPAETEQRPVYGHDFETVPAEERSDQVFDFYRGKDCETLLGNNLPFRVKYVLWGPKEDDLGLVTRKEAREEGILNLEDFEKQKGDKIRLPDADRCRAVVEEIAVEQWTFGDVTLYRLPDQ